MEENLLSQFIGRGEIEVKSILEKLFPDFEIKMQIPIEKLIPSYEYEILDQEIKNHKFDLVMYHPQKHPVVIEVNYKHREKAAKKWRQIFTNLLVNAGAIPITIDDYNCEYLFSDSIRLKKKFPWGSHIDIIMEFQRQGITPNGTLL